MKLWLLLACLMADPSGVGPNSGRRQNLPPATADFDIDEEAVPLQKSITGVNFTVSGRCSSETLQDVQNRAEALRAELSKQWLGVDSPAAWELRCEIVLHGNRGDYLKAVGAAGRQTAGTTSIQLQGQRIVRRRIDLIETSDTVPPALRHELIHVLMADLFPVKTPPRWAEEGLALLNDPLEKQAAHRLDARRLELQRFTFVELVKSEQYPGMENRAEFYGKSLLLVEFLMQSGGAETFQKFLKRSVEAGTSVALQEVYGFHSVAELDSRWMDGHAASVAAKVAAQ